VTGLQGASFLVLLVVAGAVLLSELASNTAVAAMAFDRGRTRVGRRAARHSRHGGSGPRGIGGFAP
jgi:hypothetical protein